MEDYIQFSAKTKSEAITKACMELGTSSDQLDIQVITEGSSGFFGIGSKPAIIKVRKIETGPDDNMELEKILDYVKLDSIKEEKKPEKPKPAPAKPEVPREKKEKKESKGPKAPKEPKEIKEAREPEEPKESKELKEKQPKPAKEKHPKEKVPKDKQPKEKAEKELKEPKEQKEPKESKETRNKEKAPKEPKEKAAKEKQPKEKPVKVSKPVEIITDPEVIRQVEESAAVFLKNVFAAMDLGEVEIVSKYNSEDGCLEVAFEGEDMGVLIGKRGQTLDSLQYLTSLVINKGRSSYVRVKLDTEDYRRRRKETLENLARGIAYKVKKTRKAVVLEPMNPYERRIIHSALQSSKFVETISEGEEPYRHVVVKLKKYNA